MKKIISIISFIFVTIVLFSQEKTLLTIDNKTISDKEFIRIYQKNNVSVNTLDTKTVEEYLDLFINFKLKVVESENRGMDTLPAFLNELNTYEKQLERPYFTDQDSDDRLLKEAFERQQYDVRASHILVLLPINAKPLDTLKAYQKISKIRKQIKENKISFEKAAMLKSEDPSAKENKGDLGYFTVFQMVYPFENAAYNTKVGEISEIVRTRYGYHILNVTDKRKSKGEVKVSHIMVGIPKNPSGEEFSKAKSKIKMVYDKLKGGADFVELAHLYSDDKASSQNGGELNWFGTNHMVKPFENAAFDLKNKGDFSEPIRTQFGFHIIKLIDKKEPKSFEESKKRLKRQVDADMRARVSKKVVYDRIKKEYNYKLNQKNLEAVYLNADETIYTKNWDKSIFSKLDRTLFVLNDSSYSQQAFINFLADNNYTLPSKTSVESYVLEMFQLFEKEELKKVERANLANKYPEYKFLLQEYHDGILLFDITDKEVWSKALKDSIGLGHYYDTHKENYKWGQRVEASVYEYQNPKVLKTLKKTLKKQIKKGYTPDKVLAIVNKKNESSAEFIKSDIFAKSDYKIVDLANEKYHFFENITKTPVFYTQNNKLVCVSKIIPNSIKKIDEAKGHIIADYQDYLEKKWIKELRKKYKITINNSVWEEIKSKY